jgi:hypothetical protein
MDYARKFSAVMYEKEKSLSKREIVEVFRSYGLKEMTAENYAPQLLSFCELVSDVSKQFILTPDGLLEMELEEIEDFAEEHCRRFNEGRIVDISKRLPQDVPLNTYEPCAYRVAPKRLNVQMAALKKWLHINWRVSRAKLKNPRQFRRINYESSRLLHSRLMADTLEHKDIKLIFNLSNGLESITIGLYGLMGLRPSLIPFLRVKHLHPRSYEVEGGKFRWMKTPPLVIVPAVDDRGHHVVGNKASIEFPAFIPTSIAERIEFNINQKNQLGLDFRDTKLSPADRKRDVDYLIRKYFDKVGYSGRPYDMRNYASRLLKRIELLYNNKDLKELMLGHKPRDMGGIYDFRGLSEEQEGIWRNQYVEAVDNFISSDLFSATSTNNNQVAKILVEVANKVGIDHGISYIKYKRNEMDLEMFKANIMLMIQNSQETKIENVVRRFLNERMS